LHKLKEPDRLRRSIGTGALSMNGPGLEPHRPDPVLPYAADDGFWDEAASRDGEVWRYARQLAAAAAQEHERTAGGAGLEPGQAPGEEAVRAQPAAAAAARLRDIARGVGQALLMVAAAGAGVANGMAVGGGALPLDLQSWRPLAQAAPAPPALVAGATLVSTARTVTIPALPPRAAVAQAFEPAERLVLGAATGGVPAGAILRNGPTESLVLAAATGEIPAGVITRPEPTGPVAVEPPGAPWRVQLALLRNPRHADTVWRSFVTRLGAHIHGLERHVLPTRTARGLRHLVQAGPFADAGAAEALCQRLLAAGGDCLVVPPPS
jgi:hypothetical protein